MIAPLLTIIIILTALTIYFAYGYFSMQKDFDKIKPLTMGVSPDSKIQDMTLVYESIERAVLKSLIYYIFKDIKFGSKSPVKEYFSGHYRDLISYLLNPNVTFTDEINGETITRPFSSIFIQRVYLLYLAETPESIKMLFFKYYSGYTVEDYNKDKRPKPSIASFISEYVNYFLMSRYEENRIAEAKLLNQVNQDKELGNMSSKRYQDLIDEYDKKCILNLNSSIYNIYGTGVNIPDNESQNTNTSEKPKQKKEVKKNEFVIDFHESSK